MLIPFVFHLLVTLLANSTWDLFTSAEWTWETQRDRILQFLEEGEPFVQGFLSRDCSTPPDSRGQSRSRQTRPRRREQRTEKIHLYCASPRAGKHRALWFLNNTSCKLKKKKKRIFTTCTFPLAQLGRQNSQLQSLRIWNKTTRVLVTFRGNFSTVQLNQNFTPYVCHKIIVFKEWTGGCYLKRN